MTAAWYQWYALRIGIPYALALDLPHGELMDLIAVHRIKTEGFVPRVSEEDAFWMMLDRK